MLSWYLVILVIGLIFLPLTSWVFRKFGDFGYPFAKVLGLAILSYLVFLFNSLHLLPFTQLSLWLLLLVAALVNLWLYRQRKIKLPNWKIILGYELLFLALYGWWVYLKGFEPSIHSLEKYMDFGFIQSILNGKYLPAQDMWFASTRTEFKSINYYYFGHFVTALLIKLSHLQPAVAYNLMLASILAFGGSLSFSLGLNLYGFLNKTKTQWSGRAMLAGLLALAIMNFGGNLHTIYLFTKGYVPENPVPFWQILSGYNPQQYWYPNATRFIPFTIHEFPSYSYVVSDLHGHVLDIPFVLLILALSILVMLSKSWRRLALYLGLFSLTLTINYMTNSTDFLVYSVVLFFALVINFDNLTKVLLFFGITVVAAIILTLPFSLNFIPFARNIGVNCAPDFLVKMGKLGPFLFEQDKCQTSPFWMLFILWGFFWLTFMIFSRKIFFTKTGFAGKHKAVYYFFFLYVISILLTLFAEFFYFKDIYPAHFRANTMFKLGYQAFIIMSILSAVVITTVVQKNKRYGLLIFPFLALILIYYAYAIPSYFGKAGFKTLNGTDWIQKSYPDSYQIIQILDRIKTEQPSFSIVEAHGDSYTDFNLVSAMTGLPTIIGWPVHEWLWRGNYDVVKPRVDDVRLIYEGTSSDLPKIKTLLHQYQVRYIVVAELEKQKYASLKFRKFYKIGTPIYQNQVTQNYLFKLND